MQIPWMCNVKWYNPQNSACYGTTNYLKLYSKINHRQNTLQFTPCAMHAYYLSVFSGLPRLYCVKMSHSWTWHLTKLWHCRSSDSCRHEPAHRIWSILLPKLNTSAPVLCDQHVYASLLHKILICTND